jgi:hypothetical protein
VSGQLALDLFPRPTWRECRHELCHDTYCVVPAGTWCSECDTLISQYVPASPQEIGYLSADWAWKYQDGNEWVTEEKE